MLAYFKTLSTIDGGALLTEILESHEGNLTAHAVELVLRPLGEPCPVGAGQFVLAAFGNGPRYHGCGEFHPFTVSTIAKNWLLAAIQRTCRSSRLAIFSLPCCGKRKRKWMMMKK